MPGPVPGKGFVRAAQDRDVADPDQNVVEILVDLPGTVRDQAQSSQAVIFLDQGIAIMPAISWSGEDVPCIYRREQRRHVLRCECTTGSSENMQHKRFCVD